MTLGIKNSTGGWGGEEGWGKAFFREFSLLGVYQVLTDLGDEKY